LKVLGSLAIRVVVVLLRRSVGVATPKLLSTALDKLDPSLGTMPWKTIVFWACCVWLDSRAGLEVLDSLARTRIHNTLYKQVTGLAIGHIMALSFDFHSKKDAREILKGIDQAALLSQLVGLIAFDNLPFVIDYIVLIGYITYLFDRHLTSVILGILVTYVLFRIIANPWIQHK